MNAVSGRIMFFISFCAFAALNIVPNVPSVFMGMFLILAFGWMICRRGEELILEKNGNSFFLAGLLLDAVCAIGFYTNWSSFPRLQRLAGRAGVSGSTLLIVCASVGALCAIPFMARLIRLFLSETPSAAAKRLNKLFSTKKAFYLCVLLSTLAIILQLVFAFSKAIWSDESFSLALIRHSYADMIMLTAADVHPPLYYIILKFCVDAVHSFAAGVPAVYLAKLVSVIPFILLFILSVTKVRREWGCDVSGMWAVALVAMPNLISFGVEIRMYSWSLFFVTAELLCAHDIVAHRRRLSWVFFVTCGLAAAYTHYFACIAAGIIYLSLLVWFIARDRKRLLPWLAAAAATAVGYAPWLSVFLRQAQTVSASYWIPEITFSTVAAYLTYMCENGLMLSLVIITTVFLVKSIVRSGCERWDDVFSLTGILVPVGTTIIGIVVSLIMRPVFYRRYMMPGLACLWLGMICANRHSKRPDLKAVTFVAMVILSAINILAFALSETQSRAQADEVSSFFSNHQDAIYLFNEDSHGMGTLEVMSESTCYLWQTEREPLHLQVYKNAGSLHSFSEIQDLLREGKMVVFVEDSGELSVHELLSGTDLSYIDLGKYWVESAVEFYQIVEIEEAK